MSDILTFKINLEHDGSIPENEKEEKEKEKPMKKTDLFIIGKKQKSHKTSGTIGGTCGGTSRRTI